MQSEKEVEKVLGAVKVKSNTVVLPVNIKPPILSTPTDWITFESDLHVHKTLFKNGIISIVPASEEDKWLRKISEYSIHLYSQTNDSETEPCDLKLSDKQRVLTFHFSKASAKIATDKLASWHPNEPRAFRQSNKLLSQLAQFANAKEKDAFQKCTDVQKQFFIFNPRRRDEIFLPLSVKRMGFYLYPWLSKEKPDWHFSGFEQFVTAGCLFGSSLKGRNNKGTLYPFIKHERYFFNGEHITSIVYNSHKPGPYEESLFFEFEKWCGLIDTLSDSSTNKPKRLFFHLPDYDYVLFGIELYLRGRITYKALDDFIKIIFDKKEQYVQKISELCRKYNITVTISSPFENLFGYQTTKDNLTKVIFETLQIQNYSPTLGKVDEKTQKENEMRLVRNCINRLLTNQFNVEHGKVWLDFIKSHIHENEQDHSLEDILKIACRSISTIEDLFKIANSIVIGIASKGKPEYKTCSLLPLSEKQIQINYGQYIKKSTLQSKYPPIFNATVLDSLLTYTGATNGPLFYFDTEEMKLLEQLTRNFDLLRIASNNIYLMLIEKPQNELESILCSYISTESESPGSLSSSPENFARLQFYQRAKTSAARIVSVVQEPFESESTDKKELISSDVDSLSSGIVSPLHDTSSVSSSNSSPRFLMGNKSSLFAEASNHESQKTNKKKEQRCTSDPIIPSENLNTPHLC